MAMSHSQKESVFLLCFILLLVIFNLPVAFCFPSGAPKSSCFNLIPHHGTGEPQQSTSPYQIVAETTYTPQGTFVRGVIRSNETFKGFILQARPLGTDITVGEFVWFSEESARPLDCIHPNDTLTHRNINEKQKVSFIWTPGQSNLEVETIQFRATVVKSYGLFWTNIESDIISLKQDKSHDPSLIPAGGADTSKSGTSQDSNPNQHQQEKKPMSILVGKKTQLNSTSANEKKHGTGDRVEDNQQPSSSANPLPVQQRPSFLRPQQKQQQWEQKRWPRNFPPPLSHLPQQEQQPHHHHHQQQQHQQPQQPPNMWLEPRWFLSTNQGFPFSAFPQSSRINGQVPGNSQTSDLGEVISLLSSPLIYSRCYLLKLLYVCVTKPASIPGTVTVTMSQQQ
uniref:Defense protein 3 n=1 Tax=Callistoctopus minor TaxID=515824 RepID=A0A6B9UQ41_CALMC|nr:defense protein 3 [Callistoctopus minor]